MKHSKLSLYTIVLIFALTIMSCSNIKHESIIESDINEIWVSRNQEAGEFDQLSADTFSDMVKWFNSCTDIRPNPDFAGTAGPLVSIKIMHTSKNIMILKSGEDFEIQVHYFDDKKPVSYWAKQDNIKKMLDEIEWPA